MAYEKDKKEGDFVAALRFIYSFVELTHIKYFNLPYI